MKPLIGVAAALLALAGPARAAVINVTTTTDAVNGDGFCSLREAINTANTDAVHFACGTGSGTDDIYIPAGTYVLSIPGGAEDANTTGDLDVRSSLVLHGAGAGLTVIDATGLGDRVLHVAPNSAPGIDVEIRDLTLRGGVAAGSGGGGILAEDYLAQSHPFPIYYPLRSLWVDGCAIEDNTAGAGGGIRVGQVELTSAWTLISRSVIRSNTSTSGGGGFDTFCRDFTLLDSAVVGNVATGPSIAAAAGMFLNNFHSAILRSTIADNEASGGPGGIWIGIGGNTPIADAYIVNSTISGNTTTGSVGGVSIGDATNGVSGVMLFTTVTGNVAAQAGGINVGPFALATLTIGASIVADNTAPTNADVEGSFNSAGSNLIGDGGGSSGFGATGDQVGTTGSPIDPLLGPLADNGGPTQTHALLPNSPAIDAVVNLGNSEDQRSAPRPFGASYDIGSFELGAAKVPSLQGLGVAALALALATAGALGFHHGRRRIAG